MCNLLPTIYIDSTYSIDYEDMYKRGYRGILFDIDNTLVGHNAPQSEKSLELIDRLHKIGFKTAVVSNNKLERVSGFAQPADMFYVYKAGKPLGRGYTEAINNMGLKPDEVFCVGDQIFTDVWGAGHAGLVNYLVKPLGPDIGIHIYLKRILEKPILLLVLLTNKSKKKKFYREHPEK
ncbi:MAG: HAD family hydrolase [Lachnospiraceae bacterium]|nr:HAD family hydrolase [Lachnospiraceae bacterium]